MSTPSAAVAFLNGLNGNAGMMAISTLVILVFGGKWRIDFRSPKHLVVLMIYLDCLATCVGWTASLWADYESTCTNLTLWFLADCVWSLKDASKYSYMIYRAMKVAFPESKHILKVTGVVGALSALFYWIVIGQVYDFSNNCHGSQAASGVVFSLPLLYTFWTLIDFTSGCLAISKLFGYQRDMAHATKSSGGVDVYAQIIYRESIRLAVTGTCMTVVTILAVIRVSNPANSQMITMNAFVFVLCQAVLVSSVFTGGAQSKDADNTKSKIKLSTNQSAVALAGAPRSTAIANTSTTNAAL
ncbi:Uncharacterized protein PBTT_03396 [Plasmodiophora brassicae]